MRGLKHIRLFFSVRDESLSFFSIIEIRKILSSLVKKINPFAPKLHKKLVYCMALHIHAVFHCYLLKTHLVTYPELSSVLGERLPLNPYVEAVSIEGSTVCRKF